MPLTQNVTDFFRKEVLPFAPDAWIDESKTKIGYEIPFNRYFYVYEAPRPLKVIDEELRQASDKIRKMLEELAS